MSQGEPEGKRGMMRAKGSRVTTAILAALIVPLATAADDITVRSQAAKATAGEFITRLGATLKEQIAKGGPEGAVSVCRDVAPDIANELSLKHGWKVTRVGTRVRNTMIGMPDPWEQEVLKAFKERAAQGEKYSDMSYSEVVTEPAGKYFRFMKAIGVQQQCLACHGGKAQIPETIGALLEDKYPHDKAVGYTAGDLRGAVSIKQPMTATLPYE